MPTYTIAGKRVTSPEPLSDEELAALYTELSGVKPATSAAPAPAPAAKQRFTPELPRDIRTPQDVDVRRGASGFLGIPGGAIDIATGIAGLAGENAVTRWLREKERALAAQAPSQEGYEAGKIVPQLAPALGTAKLVSKIPAASTATRALLQSTGQAGQAYAVTPSASEDREQMSFLGLGPRESAAVVEGGLGLAGEVAAPVVRSTIGAGRKGVDFARSVKEGFTGRIRGVPTTPVTEEERAALAITQRRGVTADEQALADAEKAAQMRREELNALRIRQTEAQAAREQQRQALLSQKKAAEEAETKALETVELTPTRGKQELGQRLRDTVMAARKKYIDERSQAIGKFESGDEVPVFTAAKEMEAAGEFINKTEKFQDLVKFLRERGVGRTGKSELDREEIKAFRNVLRDVTPKQRVSETILDEAGNKTVVRRLEPVDITFEKLVKLRRRIQKGDPGVTETGFQAITGDTRKNLLEKIDSVLDDFSPGYIDYNKTYAATSEPLDFLKVNTVGKKAAGFQKFSQEEFQANPEAVLDALLNNPSKTNADNLLKFVGNEGKDDIEQVVLEALVNKAGGKSSGYAKVLEKYDNFLEAFPTAKKRLQDESAVFDKATAPARAEYESAIAGLERIKGEKLEDSLRRRIATSEFQKADAIRVSTQDRLKSLQDLDKDTLIAISEEANKVPLNTSVGLAQATALAAIAGGAGLIASESPLVGILAIAGGAAGSKAARNAFAKKRAEVSNRIETEVKKIIASRSGERAAALQQRIDNQDGIMQAQRIANEALKNIGFKPGTGAVTANAIYKAFAVDKGAEAESDTPSAAGEEGIVPDSEGEPEVGSDGKSYDIGEIISTRGADDLAPLIMSIYEQESSSGKADTGKENYAGAKGPMQVTRDTFEGMRMAGLIPEDYSFDNVSHLAEAGVALIQDLARRYGNDPEKIAAAYYGGPRAVTERGIRRERRDPKNPKAPTVGQYADQVLARLMPTAQAGGMARGGVVYSPAEEMLLKRYSTGGPASRPTLPGDRSTGYKQEGDEENRLKRFLEAAATELPSAIKRGVTSNSDLAAKYLKFKFGMMSPDEAMMVARSLPETLKGAAVAAMQAVKEAPRAVAEATPESAGQFTAQMVAGELTDPTRLGRVAGTLTKPTISAMGDVVDFNKVKKQKSIDEWAEKLTQSIGNQIPMRPEGEIARNILKFKDQNKLNQTLEYMYNPESDEATFNLLMRELKKELPPDAYQMIVEGSFWNKTADEFKKNLFKLASESSKP